MPKSKQAGSPLRATRQRTAIVEALDGTSRFRSAQEIHGLLRSRGSKVGLTTVYRTLQALAEAGEVDVIRTTEGENIYRRCATPDHHHHLVCRDCGHSVEVESPEVEVWADRTARRHGFTSVTHTVEVHGLCKACSPDG